ncbi:alpha-L-rhamnosidase-like [Oppia nitens]|uniref:alpha-L-rhamnosidase-like n=1 Tax=Oppia nitens TaxID=1686743 RepID=UPI0023DB0E07|nr:alpha-L-rhamnosidase-like [Oppia nitens]
MMDQYLSIIKNNDINPIDLKTEYLVNPLAVDVNEPRFQWTLVATDPLKHNLSQKAYQILVSNDEQSLAKNVGNLWDTGKVVSDQTNHIHYKGKTLNAGQRAYWKVKVWDQEDKESTFSTVAYWGNALINWTAQWIGAPVGTQKNALKNIDEIDAQLVKSKPALMPVLYLRKHFTCEPTIKTAILYATAQGAYEVLLNGKPVADDRMSPGWTDYHNTIQYQAYDVTELLGKDNALGVILGTGWFSSYVGYRHQFQLYGSNQTALLELHIEYHNNEKIVIKSDNTWKVNTGPIIYSDILMGELYYQSRDIGQWSSPAYDDKSWLPVIIKPIDPKVKLVTERSQPVRVTQEISPKTRREIKPGVWVFDFEQNMVGLVKLHVPANSKSTRIQLRHAEALEKDGNVYVKNLRSALAIDTYVLDGNHTKAQDFEPHFTYHGFRYIEITGFPGEPQLTNIVGRVVHSDTPITGQLETSSPLVNRLHDNILWGQKSNFFSVPTDSPQRDERLGFLGDGEIFVHTASYNADVSAFFSKWMRDVREAQSSAGGFSNVAPRACNVVDGAPAWGDAGVIVPYTMYRQYGDLKMIEDNWEAMNKWMNYIGSQNPNYIWTKRLNNNYGDWLQVNANTPKEVLSTAYYGYDALLMSRLAAASNRTEDAKKYTELHQNIANAFNKAFVNSTDGHIKGETQTVYLLALAFEMLPEKLRPLAANNLAENIKAHNWHLTTGFIGVGYLCPVLTQFGHNDVAYRLLLQNTYPSWGYSIANNATTIWERWDGWTKEKGFQDPSMNSFNHYSLGSVGRWLFQSMAGIDTGSQRNEVGFKHILIRPNPGQGLTYVNASYKSINGRIDSSWHTSDKKFTLKINIPVNTRATVDLSFAGKLYEVGSGIYDYNNCDLD